MAEKQFLVKLEDQLNCSVCLDTFTAPKQLECFHIFCQQCLGRLVNRDQRSLICPTCRQVTRIPANGVADLQTPYNISELAETLKEVKAEKTYFCIEHQEKKVELYCETCGELICWKCIKKRGGKHYDHDYEELDDAIERYKKEVAASLKPLESEIANGMTSFEEFHKKILNQKLALADKIRKSFEELHGILDDRQAQLLGQLDQIMQNRQTSLQSQKKNLQTTKAEILHLIDESHREESREESLMKKTSKLKQVEEKVTSLRSSLLKPNINGDVKFVASAETIAQCQWHGQLQQADECEDEGAVQISEEPYIDTTYSSQQHSPEASFDAYLAGEAVMYDGEDEPAWDICHGEMQARNPSDSEHLPDNDYLPDMWHPRRYGNQKRSMGWSEQITSNEGYNAHSHRVRSWRGQRSDKQNWRK